MIIGVPKEIKSNENRVALTPAGANELVKRNHTVYIQTNAGADSGFEDAEYVSVGAKILPTIESVYDVAEMIVKVKEPIAREYPLIKSAFVACPFQSIANILGSYAPVESYMFKISKCFF